MTKDIIKKGLGLILLRWISSYQEEMIVEEQLKRERENNYILLLEVQDPRV